VFGSVADLLNAVASGKVRRPNIASVATTTEHHLNVSMELMKAKIHLLVEKPLAFTPAEGRTLVDFAEKEKLVLATGQVERHRAVEAFQELKGKPHFIECHRLSPFPARSTDIDVILDLMIHDIDLMLAMVNSPIKSIHAAGFPVLTNQIDIANARFEFESGCVANLTSSRISITRTRKFRIFCSDAYLSMDLGAGTYERYHKDPLEKDLAKAISHKSGSLSVEDALKEEIRDFVYAVRENRAPLVSGKDGLRALEVAGDVLRDVKERLSVVAV
jgi:predicted dehydrogenase